MKIKFRIISLLILACTQLISIEVKASKLLASFDYKSFYSPVDGPYVEVYLSIVGNSLNYVKKESERYEAKVEVTLMFSQSEKVKNFKKYVISQSAKDSIKPNDVFIDQQRVPLENGNYVFEIQLKDLNSDEKKFIATEDITLNFATEKLDMSGIQLFDRINKVDTQTRFTKSGYEIIPYVSNFYPEEIEKIGFYTELYNSNKVLEKDEKYLITYFIENNETGNIVANYKGFKKENAEEVNPIANTFLIKELPSGNYNLVIEARDKKNELLLHKKVFFQRSNPGISAFSPENKTGTFVEQYTNADTLAEYINCLFPISDQQEVTFAENQLDSEDLELMQQYFLNFWVKRDNQNPEKAWRNYYKEVLKVNENYGTRMQKGYLTDRGFRYLQYGPPNQIDKRYFEPQTYPYEVWFYHRLENQVNRRFVFWSPKSVTNDFQLLHSDANGEVRNPAWKTKIRSGNSSSPNNPQNRNQRGAFGTEDNRLFRDR